jgi:hypothetical protein
MAAGGGGGRGGLGWAILVAALAVPGFLFYNWWSHLKAEHDHAISVKASKRVDGGVFQTPPPMTGRLVNPMASSTAVPTGFPPIAETARMPATAAGTVSSGTVSAGAALPATSSGTPSGAAPAAATIVLSRDPMMSPLDAVRLREAALAEEERLRALAEAKHPRARRAKRMQPVESRIELQGIVAKSDGNNLAIINGSTVGRGESIEVDNYPGKVRILKITSSEVTLDYKGRKFTLSMSAE